MDLEFKQDESGTWDLSLNSDGDLSTTESFDTELTYALLGEQRANASEVSIAPLRRGWIGNTGNEYENGSKLWLYNQSRLTRTVMNGIQNAALLALNYFVTDNILKNVEARTSLESGKVVLQITLIRFGSRVDTRLFNLWENTGV